MCQLLRSLNGHLSLTESKWPSQRNLFIFSKSQTKLYDLNDISKVRAFFVPNLKVHTFFDIFPIKNFSLVRNYDMNFF